MFKKKQNDYEKYLKLYTDEVAKHEQTRHELEMKNIELQGEIDTLKIEVDHLKEMEKLYKFKLKLYEDIDKNDKLLDEQ